MHETQSPHPLAVCSGTTKMPLGMPIVVVMLGLLLLEPVSPLFSRMHLVRPLLPLLGTLSCIGALRLVLHLLLSPDVEARVDIARHP